MSPYKSLAILGATGNLGSQLLAALAHDPRSRTLDIRILTRPSPWQIPVDPELNVSVHQITYNTRETHAALLRALKGVDVVISTVGDDSGLTSRDVKSSGKLPGFRAQDEVARAAKEAGVRLFVPAEYGYPTHMIPDDSPMFIVGKKHHLNLLRSLNLPWLLIYAGAFPKTEPFQHALPPCNESTSKGVPPYQTTRYHVAAYLVHLILDIDPAVIEWGVYRVLGSRRDRLVSKEGKEQWVVDSGR